MAFYCLFFLLRFSFISPHNRLSIVVFSVTFILSCICTFLCSSDCSWVSKRSFSNFESSFSCDLESFVYCFIQFLWWFICFSSHFQHSVTVWQCLKHESMGIASSTTHNRNQTCFEIKDHFQWLRNHRQFHRIPNDFIQYWCCNFLQWKTANISNISIPLDFGQQKPYWMFVWANRK